MRIQFRISEEFKQRTMKLVRTRLRGYQDGWTRARPPLCRVVVGQNLELLDGVNRRQDRDAACSQLVVVIAIEQPVRALGSRAPNREGVSPTS